ncbi:hypothetical protein ACFPZ0_22515 [Streptomonospora nanhaiensis]|uniref:Uncharacterized protein n=1 Tax=Streptomonospora nanhaiensis TaxID=1323731 RepID=A0A853BQ71_9ACTN|nr:hypothetical protein [Streptomonospora nanhaiensis]MBX9388255.1 hypothetical protein [Streptomonospora nanhaiensis]NYI96806.1 hypothetical protein [Streptomonospora nanhaiensis]
MLTERIAAVDWAAIPTPVLALPAWAPESTWRPPDPAAPLRALATARTRFEAAEAVTRLENSSVLHGHMGAVFPAAVAAAPFLLEIAERPDAPRWTREAALDLLGEFLVRYPVAGYNRVGGTPLCCAVADLVRARADRLRALGAPGRELLKEAAAHWRFAVAESYAERDRLIAFGRLAGAPPAAGTRAEAGPEGPVCEVWVEYPPQDASGGPADACLRLAGTAEAPEGTVLRPAECGERLH